MVSRWFLGLQGDNDKIKLKRISATKAIAIKKAWTCIDDDQLKDTVFTWEAPLDTHTLWTSPKKGSPITCVKTSPNPALGALLNQTGTLIPGKDETRIQIKFISGKITWQREHADYITAREPNCLWRITDIRPDTNNNIMVIVNPVKRNNSKTESRIIPIKVAKTLITCHKDQEMVDTHDPLEDFPNISEQMQIPTKSLHKYFTHETCPFSVQRRTQNQDCHLLEAGLWSLWMTPLPRYPSHQVTKSPSHQVSATRTPTCSAPSQDYLFPLYMQV